MKINLVLVADRMALPGSFVTIYTALRNLRECPEATVHMLSFGIRTEEIRQLRELVTGFGATFNVVDISRTDLAIGRSLSGSWMPYAKFLIAELIEGDRVVYLDSDLIVKTNLGELFKKPMNSAVAACRYFAVGEAWSKERDFLEAHGASKDQPYFNTGVLVIDANKWAEGDLTEKLVSFADRYGAQAAAADQSIFNAVLGHEMDLLDAKFNKPCYQSERRNWLHSGEDCIIHLVGNPKPWYPLGSLNSNYSQYLSLMTEAGYVQSWDIDLGLQRGLRFLRLLKTYGRVIMNSLKTED